MTVYSVWRFSENIDENLSQSSWVYTDEPDPYAILPKELEERVSRGGVTFVHSKVVAGVSFFCSLSESSGPYLAMYQVRVAPSTFDLPIASVTSSQLIGGVDLSGELREYALKRVDRLRAQLVGQGDAQLEDAIRKVKTGGSLGKELGEYVDVTRRSRERVSKVARVLDVDASIKRQIAWILQPLSSGDVAQAARWARRVTAVIGGLAVGAECRFELAKDDGALRRRAESLVLESAGTETK